MQARTCDGCTFCCLTMGVVEIDKPKDQWCVHCLKGKGCAIYEDRPNGCMAFQCLYVQSDALPPDMRPDKVKAMFVATKNDQVIQLVVHKDYPDVWKTGRVSRYVEKLRTRFHIIVVCGEQRLFLGGNVAMPKDIEEELRKLG